MLHTHDPSAVILNHIRDLQAHLPGIYDGVELSIHDGRVSLRRACEALSLMRDDYDHKALAAIEERLAKATRALGRVRDADAGQHVLQEMERKFPFAAATIGQLRVEFSANQYRARRKAVKKLEALELDGLERELSHAWRGHSRHWPLPSRGWKRSIVCHLAVRAEHVRTSIARATGVYLPNRAHATRVAIKQLRYTLELAATLGAAGTRRSVRFLKKAQEALGAAHDREVLLEHLEHLRRRDGSRINPVEADALARFLRAEALALHQQYVESRADLLGVCGKWTPAPRRGVAARALAIAGLGVPSLLLLARNSASARTG
jgi:CHAD domain-containing protein